MHSSSRLAFFCVKSLRRPSCQVAPFLLCVGPDNNIFFLCQRASLMAVDREACGNVPSIGGKERELSILESRTAEERSQEVKRQGATKTWSMLEIEEGKIVCGCGSNILEWTIQFARQILNLKKAGGFIELIYVGNSNVGQKVKEIIASIFYQKVGSYLPEENIYLFWSRLMGMRNSRTRLAIDGSGDIILQEVESLLNWDASMSSWVMFGNGSSDDILKLEADKAMELLSPHSIWGHYTGKIGLLSALKVGLNPPLRPSDLCGNRTLIAFFEVGEDRILFCEKCSSPIEKYVLYQCNGN